MASTFINLPRIDAVPVEVVLDQANDSVAIGDGTTLVSVNPLSGALLVELDGSSLTTSNRFNEVTGVIAGITTAVITYTAIANTKILSCDFGGTNIAEYSLYIQAALNAKQCTYFTQLNGRFDFKDGLPVNTGDVITLEVVHNRPDPGDFNANLLISN